MRVTVMGFLGGLATLVSATVFVPAAFAQQVVPGTVVPTGESIPNAFDRILNRNSYTYTENAQQVDRIGNEFLGFGSAIDNAFPEAEITKDAYNLELLMKDVLKQQASTSPIIRTPDLINPFSSSLLTQPTVSSDNRVSVGDLIPEKPMLR